MARSRKFQDLCVFTNQGFQTFATRLMSKCGSAGLGQGDVIVLIQLLWHINGLEFHQEFVIYPGHGLAEVVRVLRLGGCGPPGVASTPRQMCVLPVAFSRQAEKSGMVAQELGSLLASCLIHARVKTNFMEWM